MEYTQLVSQLEHHAHAIKALTRGISAEHARWKPNTESWSILKVINHLYDEEREDFRVRLEIILFHPHDPLPDIHPVEWVTERAYNERALETSVQNFLDERAHSLTWVISLGSPNWDASLTNQWGTITAGEMFSAWMAHDVSFRNRNKHLRQLVELHYALVKEDAQPYEVGYAGDW